MGLFDNPALVGVEMLWQECISCGVTFGFSKEYDKRLRQTHQNFFCPNGHSQHYPQKTDAEKLRDEKVRLQAQLDQANARVVTLKAEAVSTERRLRSTKGVVTGMKRRLAKGKCIKCSKSFPDLASHMHTAHPEEGAKQ